VRQETEENIKRNRIWVHEVFVNEKLKENLGPNIAN